MPALEVPAHRRRIIRIRAAAIKLGAAKVCATDCPRHHDGDGVSESRCCQVCSPEYLNYLDPEQRAAVKARPELQPLPGPAYGEGGARDKDHGFWVLGKGCKLPLYLRPDICLRFWCGEVYDATPGLDDLMHR